MVISKSIWRINYPFESTSKLMMQSDIWKKGLNVPGMNDYFLVGMCHAVLIRSVMSRLFVTPWTAAHQAPLSMEILQARILEWVAMPSSRGSSQPWDQTQVSCMQAGSLPAEPPGNLTTTGVGSLSLFQGIFPTQKSNQDLLHCRWFLYQLSYQGSP